jgi:excisionase family DNA binding protein
VLTVVNTNYVRQRKIVLDSHYAGHILFTRVNPAERASGRERRTGQGGGSDDQQKRRREMTVEEAEAALLASQIAAARKALEKDLTISVPTAALLLNISKNHAYDCINEGVFPVPTLKVGRSFRVPTRALRELLQVEESAAA